jgi:hypothetical protein
MIGNRTISVVRIIGAYDKDGFNSVYAIPDEADPSRSEAPMPYDRDDAIRILAWADPDVAGQVAESVSALLRKLGLQVVEVVLPDD